MTELEYKPGSVDDFDRLYRSSFNGILYTMYGILGDRAAAEDCTSYRDDQTRIRRSLAPSLPATR